MQREFFKRSVKKANKVAVVLKSGVKIGHVYEAASRAVGFSHWEHLSANLESSS